MELTPRERAELGARFLDEVAPRGWFELVNLDTLDIGSGCNCVAAQVAGREELCYSSAWERAMYEWGIVTGGAAGADLATTDNEKAKRLGFLGHDMTDDDELREAWVEIIDQRIGARAAS